MFRGLIRHSGQVTRSLRLVHIRMLKSIRAALTEEAEVVSVFVAQSVQRSEILAITRYKDLHRELEVFVNLHFLQVVDESSDISQMRPEISIL